MDRKGAAPPRCYPARMPTIAQVEEQIYVCEGFRVRLTPLKAATKTLPSYDFVVMAPQRWRLSDWRNARLRAYVPLIRDITVLRGGGAPAKTDVQLGNLRDTYYAAKYGSLAPDAPPIAPPTALPVGPDPAPPRKPSGKAPASSRSGKAPARGSKAGARKRS